jgi:hypothetical protein
MKKNLNILIMGVVMVISFFLFYEQRPVWAGGAAAAAKKRGGMAQQQQQQAAQQQQLQAQMQKRAMEAKKLQQEQQAKEEVVEDEVDLAQIMQTLQSSSEAWSLVIDFSAKEAIVGEFIREFRRQGVAIQKPPDYYVGMIDAMAEQTPQMLQQPFESVLRVAAVLEYDFRNGQDQDKMALQVLGSPAAVEQNKKRLNQRQ